MKRGYGTFLHLLGFYSVVATDLWGGSKIPSPVDTANLALSPYVYTGLIMQKNATGSGSVAIHPRLVLGCAHLNYSDGSTWLPAGSIEWFWKWNQGNYPETGDGLSLTGYYYFSTYQFNQILYGGSNSKTYQFDFVANYSATQDAAGGRAASWVYDGKKCLTVGKATKRVTGYPAGRYKDWDSNKYRMHETDFSANMLVSLNNFLFLNGVETGQGNSGGPVWIWNNRDWAFGGVVVSGLDIAKDNRSVIGVCSLNQGNWSLILSALRQLGATDFLYKRWVPMGNLPVAIPDQSSISRTLEVADLLGTVQTIKINLFASHERGGDLIVTLRSPNGKTVRLTTAVTTARSSPPNLTLTSRDVMGFQGLSPNGLWTLTVKDSYRSKTGSLQMASMEITTR
jgi:hypothetical protein